MSDELKKTLEPKQQTEQNAGNGEPKSIRKGALSRVKEIIDEKELIGNVTAIRLIVEGKFRLEEHVSELECYKDKYYIEKERAAVLTEKLTSVNSKLIATTLGGIAAGYLPNTWNSQNFAPVLLLAIIFLVFGFGGFEFITNLTKTKKT
jgi:hypothetical protein